MSTGPNGSVPRRGNLVLTGDGYYGIILDREHKPKDSSFKYRVYLANGLQVILLPNQFNILPFNTDYFPESCPASFYEILHPGSVLPVSESFYKETIIRFQCEACEQWFSIEESKPEQIKYCPRCVVFQIFVDTDSGT